MLNIERVNAYKTIRAKKLFTHKGEKTLARKWNQKIDDRRLQLLQEGCSYKSIAQILNKEFNETFTGKAVENRCYITNSLKSQVGYDTLKNSFVVGNPSPEISQQVQLLMPLYETSDNSTKSWTYEAADKNKQKKSVEQKSLFPEELYKQNEEVNFSPEKKRMLDNIWEQFNDGKAKKILSLSDLHAPFIDFNAVEVAFKEHADADILVLNGDVFDGQAMSDFDKLNDFDIEVEFEQVFALLDVATEMFETIVWCGGNHDLSRFIRMVSRKFGQGMKKYVLKRLNPITYIAEKYDNVIVVPHYWVQIGKSIFVHPDGYSSALMSTAMSQEKILRSNIEMLPHPEFQLLVQGHTHDLGEYFINGTKIIEQGHLGYTPDYRWDKPTVRKWQQGYAVVHLNQDGSVDFNKTRSYFI